MHHVVVLEAANSPSLALDFPHTIEYHDFTTDAQMASRISAATIAVASTTPLTADHIAAAPQLQCVSITATGLDGVDRRMFADAGITVTHCPQTTWQPSAVVGSERQWIQKGLLTSLWPRPPLGCSQETLAIVGYGALGRRIEQLASGVGFSRIVVAERKNSSTVRAGRLAFDEALRAATTVVVCCPKQPDTIGLIGRAELDTMGPDAVLINVGRGGVVDEVELAAALREGRISAAGVDVLETEPGGRGTSPLLPETGEEVPNLTVSAHVAWYSGQTVVRLQEMLKAGIEGHVRGDLMEGEGRETAVVWRGEVVKE